MTLLTQKEVAQRIGCNRHTLTRLAKKEGFPQPTIQKSRTILLYDEASLPQIQAFVKPVGRPKGSTPDLGNFLHT